MTTIATPRPSVADQVGGALNHYEWLGIERDAGQDEVREAYVKRTRQFHPDQHPAGPEQAARLAKVMARINEAYAVLRSQTRRREYDTVLAAEARVERRAASAGHQHAISPRRPPRDDECLLCGAMPARALRFEHQDAWVLGATGYTLQRSACR
jgi:hypothetical protein